MDQLIRYVGLGKIKPEVPQGAILERFDIETVRSVVPRGTIRKQSGLVYREPEAPQDLYSTSCINVGKVDHGVLQRAIHGPSSARKVHKGELAQLTESSGQCSPPMPCQGSIASSSFGMEGVLAARSPLALASATTTS